MIELTERANARLLQLKFLRDDAVALADSTVNRMGQLRRALVNAPPDASSLEFEISRLGGNLSDHKMHADNLTQLLAQVGLWHQTLKNPVVDAKPVKVKLRDGETVSSAILDVRRHIAELDTELRTVQHSSPTPGEQKAAADLWLQNLPAHSRPRIKANKHDQFAVEFGDPTSHTVRLPIASILYWLFPEELRARLHAEVDSLPTPALVLSAEKKAERVAEVRGLMLEAERQEAALIEFGEQEGQRLVFRPFISPLALLGLAFKNKESQRAAA